MIDDVTLRNVRKRRTFAIISHPDAGKTTLTEKLLLFGGAIQMAGAVKGRKATRHATSDWMRLEQERGISVTSSVMQFPYAGAIVNLLDTPGHEDFSEDTYRTLTAVDSALMVIDAAKGVEARTIKLMEVCRLRATPIMSFINKLDRDGRPPIDSARRYRVGARHRVRASHLADRHGPRVPRCIRSRRRLRVPLSESRRHRMPDVRRVEGLAAPELAAAIGDDAVRALREEVELVRGATPRFEHTRYLEGLQTPVFFGAAIHNFGVRELLDSFVRLAPPPQAARDRHASRRTERGRFQRLRLQDPGEHGSRAPRPDRVRPGLLGLVRARHAHVSHASGSRGSSR